MEKKDFLYQSDFDPEYCIRSYRDRIKSPDLLSFQVKEKESDLLIQTPVLLQKEALASLRYYRTILENYIKENPVFATTFAPYPYDKNAHHMIKEMIDESACCQVGPMASVAGCIARYVGQELLFKTDEVIIENGGDVYIKSSSIRRVIIYAGSSPLSNKLCLKINSKERAMGVCTSSGTVGPSFSRGKADAVTILSYSATLADAAATAIGNIIQTKEDIQGGLNLSERINGILGTVIIKDDKIGMWGEIDYEFV
jgi:ApbE superfamily uncharacterized protein (UPF0280 family)